MLRKTDNQNRSKPKGLLAILCQVLTEQAAENTSSTVSTARITKRFLIINETKVSTFNYILDGFVQEGMTIPGQ